MAKYLVTSDSYFTPLTYDQIVKPLQQMTDAQNATADAYDALNLETEALGRYISENDNDSDARAIYDSYLNKLHSLQDELWQNGYSAKARRGLTAARAGYANDILRLKKAIESRAARSKEYWDAVHNNPDLIYGFDPGKGGLNDYLANENYGSDWFSYDAQDFIKNLAADAQAKAAEQVDEAGKNYANVPGYITHIANHGFTGKQVGDAVMAVRNGTYTNLEDGPTKILAEMLDSHIKATGAYKGKNISEEQYNRFFDYGRYAMAAGIKEPDIKDYKDPVFESNLDYNNWVRKEKYKERKAAEEEARKKAQGYEFQQAYARLESSDANELESKLNKAFGYKNFVDHDGNPTPKTVILMNGEPAQVSNSAELRAYEHDNEPYRIAYNRFNGLDLGEDGSQTNIDKSLKVKKKWDGTYEVSALDPKTNRYNADAKLTEAYNYLKADYDEEVRKFKEKNKALYATKDISMSAKEEKKLRDKYDGIIPGIYEVPLEDLETVIKRSTIRNELTEVPTIGNWKQYDDVAQDVLQNIRSYVGAFESAGYSGKTSPAAFYPVKAGGYEYDKNGTTNLMEVFGVKSSGEINKEALDAIYVLPEDVHTEAEGGTKARIRTAVPEKEKDKNGNIRIKHRTWVVDAKMLGPAYARVYNNPQFVATVQNLNAPLMAPSLTLLDSNENSKKFGLIAADILKDFGMPIVPESQRYPTAKEIVRRDDMWSAYRMAVNNYISIAHGLGIERQTDNARIIPTKTGRTAEPFNR